MSNDELESVKTTFRMPKNMEPSIEYWESLGFVFSNIKKDDLLCNVVLPEGWDVIISKKYLLYANIVDQNGLKRGERKFKSLKDDNDKGYTRLIPRYSVFIQTYDETPKTVEVVFGNHKERLFVTKRITADQIDKIAEMKQEVTSFANEHWPDWESLDAYWDIDVKENVNNK